MDGAQSHRIGTHAVFLGCHRNRNDVLTVGVEEPGGDSERGLRPPVANVDAGVPTVDEKRGLRAVAQGAKARGVDVQAESGVLVGGQVQLDAGAVPGDTGLRVQVVGLGPLGVVEAGHVEAGFFAAQAAVVVERARGVGGCLGGKVGVGAVDFPGGGGAFDGHVKQATVLLGQAVVGPVQVLPEVVDQHRYGDLVAALDGAGGDVHLSPVASGVVGPGVDAVNPHLHESGVLALRGYARAAVAL